MFPSVTHSPFWNGSYSSSTVAVALHCLQWKFTRLCQILCSYSKEFCQMSSSSRDLPNWIVGIKVFSCRLIRKSITLLCYVLLIPEYPWYALVIKFTLCLPISDEEVNNFLLATWAFSASCSSNSFLFFRLLSLHSSSCVLWAFSSHLDKLSISYNADLSLQ